MDDLWKFFFSEELIEDYYCENCKRKREVAKYYEISRLPKNLVLSFKRFSYDMNLNKRTKISKNIQFPEIFKIKEKDVEIEYKLYGIVFHTGIIFKFNFFFHFKFNFEKKKKRYFA